MSELVRAVQQGLGLSVLLVLPVLAAAVLGSVLASVLATFAGIQDQTVTLVSRALAVVLAVVMLATTMTSESRALTTELWSGLADVGRRQGP